MKFLSPEHRREQILIRLGELHAECILWASSDQVSQRVPDLSRRTVHNYLLELEKMGMVEKRYGAVLHGGRHALFRRV